MIKENLSLLNDKPNIFDFPQATIDPFRIEEEDREIFISTAKIFLSKSKTHFTSKYVDFHVKNNLKFFDIIRLPKYPLPAVYNKTTKRCIINLSAIGKKSVSNINMRDIYTLIVYSHICSTLSSGAVISEENADPFCEYMIQVFLKIFAKTYGLTGSYVDMIPQVRLLVALYLYVSFFGIKQNIALQRSSYLSKMDPKKIQLDFSKYDFMKISDLLMALSDGQIMPGLGTYRFLDRMIKTLGTINLPFFEDIMRFSSIMISSSINGNSYFPPHLQMYNQKLYLKVNSIIEETVDKVMIR
jgi:hypothetical protein